jgi:tetratricopeptide (TPR) repeat protein
VLLTLGRADEALGAFGRALALDPGNARALNNRGAALLALGQKEAARADFERALKRDACLFDARLNLQRMGVRTYATDCGYTPAQRAALGD